MHQIEQLDEKQNIEELESKPITCNESEADAACSQELAQEMTP